MKTARVRRTMENLHQMGLDQVLITDPSSIRYLTGYDNDPMERFQALYLAVDGDPTIFVNRMFPDPSPYVENVISLTDTDDPIEVLSRLCVHDAPLGVDGTLESRWLTALMDADAATDYRVATSAVMDARAHKDVEEQELMANASAINDAAMGWLKSQLRVGVTERQIARDLLEEYERLGADGYSFAPIVSFGANAANPHHEPDATQLKYGDVALFDVGCYAKGYAADMTRTFVMGEANEAVQRVYDVVLKANRAAEQAIHPGVTFAEIDAAARQVIEGAGWGERFTHRLGHSIGIDVHEAGDVSAANPNPVEAGMVFSIEPGIYLPGEFGIRIEDLVLVTPDGHRVLNHFDKELQEVR